MDINKDLVAASATPLVLAILAEGESYGYAILKRVSELSGGRLEWSDGMLYPVLHRLERLGYISGKWQKSESGRRRKYYRITPQGREQLALERRQWQAVDEALRNAWSRRVLSPESRSLRARLLLALSPESRLLRARLLLSSVAPRPSAPGLAGELRS